MTSFRSTVVAFLLAGISILAGACNESPERTSEPAPDVATSVSETDLPQTVATPAFPDLQAELTDERFKTTDSEIGAFDFRNFTYPLPRGWQHPEDKEITLENGKVKPVAVDVDEAMSNEARAERKAARRIGMSFVNTRFFDATGDGADEAIVILKVETGGSAIPQLVYIFQWRSARPELIWNFRTGDRADGGLKDIRLENGVLTVELFGQDRFLLGEIETGKITGDEEQLCCPTYFTRTTYKWNGKNFVMQGKRLTLPTSDPAAKPLENFGDIMNDPIKSRKYLNK